MQTFEKIFQTFAEKSGDIRGSSPETGRRVGYQNIKSILDADSSHRFSIYFRHLLYENTEVNVTGEFLCPYGSGLTPLLAMLLKD